MSQLFSKFSSPSVMIHEGWERLKKVPGGKKIFSFLVGQYIPYTGSISPLVLEIEKGRAVVVLNDRRGVRNHLDSIHAIAIANLGEFTTGLSLISQLNGKEKSIIVKLEIEYLKKARGDLRAEAFSQIGKVEQDAEFKITAAIKNLQDEVVAKVTATWRVRP